MVFGPLAPFIYAGLGWGVYKLVKYGRKHTLNQPIVIDE